MPKIPILTGARDKLWRMDIAIHSTSTRFSAPLEEIASLSAADFAAIAQAFPHDLSADRAPGFVDHKQPAEALCRKIAYMSAHHTNPLPCAL